MDEVMVADILTAVVFTLVVASVLAFGGLVIWTLFDIVVYQIKLRKDKKKGTEYVGRRSG